MRFRRDTVSHILTFMVIAGIVAVGVRSDGIRTSGRQITAVASTATATPLSDDEEMRLLDSGRALRRQGEFAEAIATIQKVASSRNPEHASLALLEIAKDQSGSGDDPAAEGTLQTLRTKYPTSVAGDEAQFHLGQVEARRGEFTTAVDDLEAYAKRHREIAGYVDVLVSRYQEQRGNLAGARALATEAVDSSSIVRARIDALEQLRDVEKKQNNDAAYLDATNRLIALATIPTYRAELTYERAVAEHSLGHDDAAIEDFRTVVRQFPDSSYAVKTVDELRQILGPSAVPDDQRALVDYFQGRYQSAIEGFTRVLSVNPASDSAWYYRAMARLKAGDDHGAAVELSDMADRFPTSPLTPGALYTAGKLYEDEGDRDTALAVYQKLIQQFPSSVQATNGHLRAGFVLYERADYQGSIAALAAAHGSPKVEAQASFWEGKSYQMLGDNARATQAWTNAAKIDATGYYGQRAAQLLAGIQPVAPASPQTSVAGNPPAAEQSDLASWYAGAGKTSEAAIAAVRQDSGYQRMTLLFDLGLTSQAGWEVSALSERLGANPALLAALGQVLDEAGEYNATFRVGVRLQTVAGDSANLLPLALQRLAYPLAFPELIQTQAAENHVDPLLLLALVRQESGYDPNATSSANAMGLTQVVPATATGLAKALNLENFSADMLYRPSIAVQFGARYLSQQVARYQGQIYPALAGYNAGNSNVDRWLAQNGAADPDVFVEQIPFPETHDYVQIVYANYLNYRRIYR